MTWPLEREGVRHFAEGLEEILVVEEKRAVIENQLKEQLYNWREDVRPRVIGKFDENRNWILPSTGELTPARIARVIAARIGRFYTSERIAERLAFLAEQGEGSWRRARFGQAHPLFLLGLPAQHLDRVPEGSRALAGIGCHYLVAVHGPLDRDLHPDGRRRGDRGSARRRSPRPRTSSPISATAPTPIPASWRSAPRSRPRSTSPTRSSSTTRWR